MGMVERLELVMDQLVTCITNFDFFISHALIYPYFRMRRPAEMNKSFVQGKELKT